MAPRTFQEGPTSGCTGAADTKLVTRAGTPAFGVSDILTSFVFSPTGSGFDLGRGSRDPHARIVLVTVHAEPMLVEAGLEAGALGYVLKETAGEDLTAAVYAALEDRRYVSPAPGDIVGGPVRE